MELQLTVPNKETSRTITVNEEVFGCPFNEPLIHQVTTAYLAGGRAGTVRQKSRSEVSGSKRKLWKQKGTGRARVGAGNVNIWRGGGMAFPARPSDYTQKVNRKMFQAAMRSILSELARSNRIIFVENFSVDSRKTKPLINKLKEMAIDHVLIVTDKADDQLVLASRNIPNVEICEAKKVNPVSLLSFRKVIMTELAVKQLEEWLA